jgi:hypothetical protein
MLLGSCANKYPRGQVAMNKELFSLLDVTWKATAAYSLLQKREIMMLVRGARRSE